MKFRIITLFPDMFEGPLTSSILKRALDKGVYSLEFVDLRDFGLGKRRQVDDTPYGGGAGMVLRVDVVAEAIAEAKKDFGKSKIVLLTPQGKLYTQGVARDLATVNDNLVIICGHYEGFDERIRGLVDIELSVGEYILTGGEIAAMAIIDSVVRLLPGALGSPESIEEETFSQEGVIEYPHYTKPVVWQDKAVPEVLLSGDHEKIRRWRDEESKKRSIKNEV
jgi:tRNA (guanine37-N1)-methyltransferase